MKKILVNHESWQKRVAVLDCDRLQDLYLGSTANDELEKCFFKGNVAKVLPGIQTAFVDIGVSKAGFLHITEIDRTLALERMAESEQVDEPDKLLAMERNIKRTMDIAKIFREGEDVLVQVIKEPIHEKGAKLSTCFTLPGKFVVLMPNIPQLGVSKKIENREERSRLRELVKEQLSDEMGAIIRTNADGRAAKDIKKDLSILIDTWKGIQKKFKTAKQGESLFNDLPIFLRAVREHLDDDVESIICDSQEDFDLVKAFIKKTMPELAHTLKLYSGDQEIFEYYDIDRQIEEALNKKVHLKSGGTLIIELTEAMAVIDVNTGKFIGRGSLEETILKTNLEAADEIVRQLRLRNIGGLIVIDFIDMGKPSARQKLSRHLEKALKERDKFQSVTLKVSEFGLVQMTRKRSGKTLAQQFLQECSACKSYGYVRATPTLSYEILRAAKGNIQRDKLKGRLSLKVSPAIFSHLVDNEFGAVLQLEKDLAVKVVLESSCDLTNANFVLQAEK
ncbi:Rne/Rng family ribonuclease [bacterium]|nr:Rne/Rng family ribonuclease [bacterium]